MAVINWSHHALEDYYKLYRFLKLKNVNSARRSSDAIVNGIELLEKFPEIGRPLQDKLKQRELYLKFGVGSYVIRYKYLDNEIFILRMWHSKETRQ